MKKLMGMLFAALAVAGCVEDEVATDEQQSALAGKEDPGGPTTQGGCDWYSPCGEVQNNSGRTVTISLNWTCDATTGAVDSSCPQNIETLAPGRHRGGGNVDVDAFRVDTGCTYNFHIDGLARSRGAGWYKFSSVNTITIDSTSCN